MSKAVKMIKKGVKSAGKRITAAAKGDLRALASVATLGASEMALRPIEYVGEKAKDAILPKLPELPDMPDVNINTPPPPATAGGQGQRLAPNVDIGTTEGVRRTQGSAKGARKLRVPLGGLGR